MNIKEEIGTVLNCVLEALALAICLVFFVMMVLCLGPESSGVQNGF